MKKTYVKPTVKSVPVAGCMNSTSSNNSGTGGTLA